jgi:phosphoribosyl 1,2-cyclic phosphate phosphodiesterase
VPLPPSIVRSTLSTDFTITPRHKKPRHAHTTRTPRHAKPRHTTSRRTTSRPPHHLTPHHAPEPFTLLGARVVPLRLRHGVFDVLGFRFGDIAYCTDTNNIPPDSMERLHGLDTLILDGLRWELHPTHYTIEQALEVITELAPRRAILTHIAHQVLHARDMLRLPDGVEFAVDGLTIES